MIVKKLYKGTNLRVTNIASLIPDVAKRKAGDSSQDIPEIPPNALQDVLGSYILDVLGKYIQCEPG